MHATLKKDGMSYDCYMMIDTGGKDHAIVEDIGNYTYNAGPMFRQALGCGLIDLEGKPGAEIEPLLARAVAHMVEHPEIYEPMNPPNGWGDYDGARRYLTEVWRACQKHPKAYLAVR